MSELKSYLNSQKRLLEYTSGRGYFTPAETKQIYNAMGGKYSSQMNADIESYVDDVMTVEAKSFEDRKEVTPAMLEKMVANTNPTRKTTLNSFGEIISVIAIFSFAIIGIFFFNNSTGYAISSLSENVNSFELGIFFIILAALVAIYFIIKRRKIQWQKTKHLKKTTKMKMRK